MAGSAVELTWISDVALDSSREALSSYTICGGCSWLERDREVAVSGRVFVRAAVSSVPVSREIYALYVGCLACFNQISRACIVNYCKPRHFFPRFPSHPAFVVGDLCGAEFPLLSSFVCYPFEKLYFAGSGKAKLLDFEAFEKSLCVRSSASVSFWISASRKCPAA
ncbi:hypothetical protein F511_28860 [Dorcoceras hygrometricum]|uniref:Uncharacterized protein n=1 Tax=Dorcoceras hygrometricum TaxID=472368 RepID=A0A2Z7C749_9LAMI|nr:hypothetical protein F511_28860 [Dorcoceras hygrometricum]